MIQRKNADLFPSALVNNRLRARTYHAVYKHSVEEVVSNKVDPLLNTQFDKIWNSLPAEEVRQT